MQQINMHAISVQTRYNVIQQALHSVLNLVCAMGVDVFHLFGLGSDVILIH